MRKFHFRRVRWSGMATDHLEPALKADPTAGIDWLENEVNAERMILIGVYDGRKRVGSVACRIEVLTARELVIVAVGGRAEGVSLYRALLPYWDEIARIWHCAFIRAHSTRRGAFKHLERGGYVVAETVFRKAI